MASTVQSWFGTQWLLFLFIPLHEKIITWLTISDARKSDWYVQNAYFEGTSIEVENCFKRIGLMENILKSKIYIFENKSFSIKPEI